MNLVKCFNYMVNQQWHDWYLNKLGYCLLIITTKFSKGNDFFLNNSLFLLK